MIGYVFTCLCLCVVCVIVYVCIVYVLCMYVFICICVDCVFTPGLHNKIPAYKIFARGWVAQEPICS